ncbi:MAG: Cna B-type domain-containing protein [Clostridia bacterium]|nr:Cna B-type domain-containing protein [Clostridia bacterium]
MVKRITALLLCVCFLLVPFYAQAASTSDASKPISPTKECALTLSLRYGDTAFSAVNVKLYKIADFSADFQFTLTPEFAETNLKLNGIKANSEWQTVRTTLESHIISKKINHTLNGVTNDSGKAVFDALNTGLYLAIADDAVSGDLTCYFEPTLVTLPTLDKDNNWQYQVEVAPKPGVLPPLDPDEEIELKVIKLGKGDKASSRPKSIKIEILCDGEIYKTVTLNAKNNWSYGWSAKNDGAIWTVVEPKVPSGYTTTYDKRGSVFIVTNIYPPNGETPVTGDTSNILLYVILMVVAGTALILLGVTGKRKTNEK